MRLCLLAGGEERRAWGAGDCMGGEKIMMCIHGIEQILRDIATA